MSYEAIFRQLPGFNFPAILAAYSSPRGLVRGIIPPTDGASLWHQIGAV
jgi:hypothetical protein